MKKEKDKKKIDNTNYLLASGLFTVLAICEYYGYLNDGWGVTRNWNSPEENLVFGIICTIGIIYCLFKHIKFKKNNK